MTVLKIIGGYVEVENAGGPVDPGYGVPGPPPQIWPSPGHPAHPIAPGGRPPSIWPSPGHPAHPIAPGGPPPGIWGGAGEGFPTPPIFLPPSGGHPGQPPGIWGPPGPWPTPPIYIPSPPPEYPNPPPEATKPPPEGGGWGYDEQWGWFLVPPPGTPSPKS